VGKDERRGVVQSAPGQGGVMLVRWDDGEAGKVRRKDLELLLEAEPDFEEDDPDEEAALRSMYEMLSTKGLRERVLHSIPKWAIKFAAYAAEFTDCEAYDLPRVQLQLAKPKVIPRCGEVCEESSRATACVQPDTSMEEQWTMLDIDSKGLASERITNLVWVAWPLALLRPFADHVLLRPRQHRAGQGAPSHVHAADHQHAFERVLAVLLPGGERRRAAAGPPALALVLGGAAAGAVVGRGQVSRQVGGRRRGPLPRLVRARARCHWADAPRPGTRPR
jgi:hypothetical protein